MEPTSFVYKESQLALHPIDIQGLLRFQTQFILVSLYVIVHIESLRDIFPFILLLFEYSSG